MGRSLLKLIVLSRNIRLLPLNGPKTPHHVGTSQNIIFVVKRAFTLCCSLSVWLYGCSIFCMVAIFSAGELCIEQLVPNENSLEGSFFFFFLQSHYSVLHRFIHCCFMSGIVLALTCRLFVIWNILKNILHQSVWHVPFCSEL